MEFREAEQKDVAVICELVAAAIAHMQEQGIDQWDKYYPTAEDFLSSVFLYAYLYLESQEM